MFWKLSKTPNSASSSFEGVSKFTTAHVFWRRSKLWVFWKKRFFSKKPCNVFKNTKHGYFLLECLSKIIIAYANSKRSKLEFSSKKLMFFCEQILERLQEHFLAFFYQECVWDFHIASEILKQSNLRVFCRNRCCIWNDPFFPKPINVAIFSYLAFQ